MRVTEALHIPRNLEGGSHDNPSMPRRVEQSPAYPLQHRADARRMEVIETTGSQRRVPHASTHRPSTLVARRAHQPDSHEFVDGEPGLRDASLRSNVQGNPKVRAQAGAVLDALGVAHDRTRTDIINQTARLDVGLASAFLDRLQNLRRAEAGQIIREMRCDVARQEGPFFENPAGFVVETLERTNGSLIKPEWRIIGAMAPREVPGLGERVGQLLDEVFERGFGYAMTVDDAGKRREKVMNAQEAFFAVLERVDPELRGELIDRLNSWPKRQCKALVETTAFLGTNDFTGLRQVSAEEIGRYENHWRRELSLDDNILRFEDASGFESVGSFYRVENYEDPNLLSASVDLLKQRQHLDGEWLGTHVRRALYVLSESSVPSGQVDEALRDFARNGDEQRFQAVIGLVKRGADHPPYEVLVETATDRKEGAGVLNALFWLFRAGELDLIPEAELQKIVQALKDHPRGLDSYPARWISNNVPSAIEFVERIGFIGPQTRAAIEEASR